MEPIISPWAFYLVSLIYNLSCALALVMVIAITVLFIYGIFMISDHVEINTIKKRLKPLIIITLISVPIVIVLPDKPTMYAMIISKEITIERLEKVKDSSDIMKSYISDLIITTAEKLGNSGKE